MKFSKITLLLTILATPFITAFQEPQFVYCNIVATEKYLSNKVTIELDFGQKMKYVADNRPKDKNGKAVVFNTNVEAMNYMRKQGWELIQITMTALPNGPGSNTLLYVTVMKKPLSELDEEAKKEYLNK